MELCTGGDLNARKNLGESAVCSIMDQLMHALAYMHKRNFCHRDLKLENVMYESPDPASLSIKLIDFGLSDTYTKGQKMARACGTIYTAAPEVLLGSTYTTQTDVWSAGVVAFVLLCEECPFMRNLEDMRDPEMVQKLREAKLQVSPLHTFTLRDTPCNRLLTRSLPLLVHEPSLGRRVKEGPRVRRRLPPAPPRRALASHGGRGLHRREVGAVHRGAGGARVAAQKAVARQLVLEHSPEAAAGPRTQAAPPHRLGHAEVLH